MIRILFWGMLTGLLLMSAPLRLAQAAVSDKVARVENYMSDAAITTELKGKFLVEKDLDSMDIKVETNKGVVSLRGQVQKKSQADLAEKIARETKGVRKVENKISVMP